MGEQKEELPTKEHQKHKEIVASSRSNANDATSKSSIGMIGRIFNEFPLQFREQIKQADSKEIAVIHYAITPETVDDWAHRAALAIKSCNLVRETITLPLTLKDGSLSSGAYTLIKVEDLKDSKKSHASTTFDNLIEEILLKSVSELLDENGEVQKEIATLLGIDTLIADNFQNGMISSNFEIKLQLIVAYGTQLIISNMIPFMMAYAPPPGEEGLGELDMTDMANIGKTYPSKVLAFQQYFFDRLMEKNRVIKSKEGDELLVPTYTQFFRNKIHEHVNRLFNPEARYAECAVELEKISPIKVAEIIAHDLEDSKSLCAEMKSDAHAAHRITFWIKVLESIELKYRKDPSVKYFSLMQSILKSLQESSFDLPSLMNQKTQALYHACILASQNPPTPTHATVLFPSKMLDANLTSLNKLLNLDDNIFIFEQVRKISKQSVGIFSKGKELLAQMINMETQASFLYDSPVNVSRSLLGMVQGESNAPEYQAFLIIQVNNRKNAQFSRERERTIANFQKALESDSQLIKKLTSKLPKFASAALTEAMFEITQDDFLNVTKKIPYSKLLEEYSIAMKKHHSSSEELIAFKNNIKKSFIKNKIELCKKLIEKLDYFIENEIDADLIKTNPKIQQSIETYRALKTFFAKSIANNNEIHDDAVKWDDLNKTFKVFFDNFLKLANSFYGFTQKLKLDAKIALRAEGAILVEPSVTDEKKEERASVGFFSGSNAARSPLKVAVGKGKVSELSPELFDSFFSMSFPLSPVKDAFSQESFSAVTETQKLSLMIKIIHDDSSHSYKDDTYLTHIYTLIFNSIDRVKRTHNCNLDEIAALNEKLTQAISSRSSSQEIKSENDSIDDLKSIKSLAELFSDKVKHNYPYDGSATKDHTRIYTVMSIRRMHENIKSLKEYQLVLMAERSAFRFKTSVAVALDDCIQQGKKFKANPEPDKFYFPRAVDLLQYINKCETYVSPTANQNKVISIMAARSIAHSLLNISLDKTPGIKLKELYEGIKLLCEQEVVDGNLIKLLASISKDIEIKLGITSTKQQSSWFSK
ncbi:MAG: hypothetical protein ABI597_07775 [Gammaproteobacteria bacterium]